MNNHLGSDCRVKPLDFFHCKIQGHRVASAFDLNPARFEHQRG